MWGRGLGHIPDAPDKRDWDIDKMGLGNPSGEIATLRHFCPPIYNQGGTSSCVAQSVAGAIEILEYRYALERGEPVADRRPSRSFLYHGSRAYHTHGRVSDTGTYLRTCVKVAGRTGVPDEALCPFSTSPLKINKQPPSVAYFRGHARRGGEYFRIYDEGEGRIHAIKAALDEGYPVCFGTTVTRDFQRSDGAALVQKPAKSDRVAGGHAMVIVGYERTAGGLTFQVRNSWGEGWRDKGYCSMTEEYIRWDQSRDFQIIRGWERLRNWDK